LIDKRLTPELKNEGLARDIVRNVQNLRKQANLDIADRISLGLITDSEALRNAIEQCGEYIQTETLATKLTDAAVPEAEAQTEVKIDGQPIRIELVRSKPT
jgi:isoleucyl-tRNA synthetase